WRRTATVWRCTGRGCCIWPDGARWPWSWPSGGSVGSETGVIGGSGLVKPFGRRTVGTNVTFTVEQGELFGPLGPTCAGETTTRRMLSTGRRPTRGTARVAGYDVVRESEQVRARLGVLPTDPGLYGRLTAAENLRFYGRLCGLGGAELERRIDELLE